MQKLVLEPGVQSRLRACDKPVEICDDSGNTIGRFVPEEWFRTSAYDWARSSISDAELDRRSREPGGYSLDQVLERPEKP